MSGLTCQMQSNQILFAFLFFLKLYDSYAHYDDDPSEDEQPLCTLNEIQYAASLAYLHKSSILCGGFLVSSHWFITTSSCTAPMDRPSSYIIMGGSSTLQKLLCKRVYRHPQYDPKTRENDISLVRVLGAFSTHLKYPRLAGKGFSSQCGEVTMVAWAANRQGSRIYNLEELPELFCMQATLLEPSDCTTNEATSTVPHKFLLCSSPGATSEHPCEHDMGGPLLCNDVVVGMSFKSGDCSQPHKQLYTAYVKIEEYYDFFKSVLEKDGDTLKEKKNGNVSTYTVVRNGAADCKISSKIVLTLGLVGINWVALSFFF